MTPETNHLTEADLTALITETAPEPARLALAEHLSVCDSCLLRYTQALTDEVLLDPPETLRPRILRRLRERAVRLFANRYAAATAAIALAMLLWSGGIFTDIVPAQPAERTEPGLMERFGDQLDRFSNLVSDGLFRLSTMDFDFSSGGDAAATLDKE